MRKQNRFPPDRDEERVRRIIDHYEAQSEEEALAEDEAAFQDESRTFMEIPTDLAPTIRQLIARHRQGQKELQTR